MSDEKKWEVAAAQAELRDALAQLARFQGREPEPYVPREPPVPPYCSFCGEAKNHVEHMISGPSVFICSACIEICHELLREARAK